MLPRLRIAITRSERKLFIRKKHLEPQAGLTAFFFVPGRFAGSCNMVG